MMDEIFAPDGLLEYDGQHLALTPLLEDVARDDLRRSFRELGLDIAGRALPAMLIAADGKPMRLMLIANKAARLAAETGEEVIDEDLVKIAHREARGDRLWEKVE